MRPFSLQPPLGRSELDLPDIHVRAVTPDERPQATPATDFPTVVEPRDATFPPRLEDVLSRLGPRTLGGVVAAGAVLFRGFRVLSAPAMDRALRRVDGLLLMSGYFMHELGRDRLAGTTALFTTNTLYHTGGSFRFGGFHTENYYSADVPAYLVFGCLRAPWLGGETALVHLARVFDELPLDLRTRLEEATFFARAWRLDAVCARYGLPPEVVETRCRDAGLEVLSSGGERTIRLYQPPVLTHPETGRKALHMNLSAELPSLDDAIRPAFLPRYADLPWLIHRLGWRSRAVGDVLHTLAHIPRAVMHPRKMLRLLTAPRPAAGAPGGPARTHRPADVIGPEDIAAIAAAIVRHTSICTWRAGDVLLVDNRQLGHAGMPGFGPRTLAVALANPFRFSREGGATLHERLLGRAE